MEITAVRVRKIETTGRMRAIASITFNDAFVVHDIRIIDGDDGLFVAMPSKRMPDGEFRDTAHPINSETRTLIQNAILEAYRTVPEEHAEQEADVYEEIK